MIRRELRCHRSEREKPAPTQVRVTHTCGEGTLRRGGFAVCPADPKPRAPGHGRSLADVARTRTAVAAVPRVRRFCLDRAPPTYYPHHTATFVRPRRPRVVDVGET